MAGHDLQVVYWDASAVLSALFTDRLGLRPCSVTEMAVARSRPLASHRSQNLQRRLPDLLLLTFDTRLQPSAARLATTGPFLQIFPA